MASNAIDLAITASKITTIGKLRAAMGAVTLTLSQGYARLSDISTIAGEQDAARSLLDTVNKSATILYGLYNDDADLQDEEISTSRAHSAGLILSEANDALKSIESAANEKLWDIATIADNAMAIVGTQVGTTVQGVTNAIAAGGTALIASAWPTILIIGAAALVYVFRKPIIAAISKVGG